MTHQRAFGGVGKKTTNIIKYKYAEHASSRESWTYLTIFTRKTIKEPFMFDGGRHTGSKTRPMEKYKDMVQCGRKLRESAINQKGTTAQLSYQSDSVFVPNDFLNRHTT